MSDVQWQKSSYSAEQANCVELAASQDTVWVRESDAPDVVLATSPPALRALLAATKAGAFSHLSPLPLGV
jgi:Domain of unknown function (DUF397)